jgi:hypothetical protein
VGKLKYLGKIICPVTTLYTADPAWLGQGSKSGIRGERSATNCPSHGTAGSWRDLTEPRQRSYLFQTGKWSTFRNLAVLVVHINLPNLSFVFLTFFILSLRLLNLWISVESCLIEYCRGLVASRSLPTTK